MGQKMRQQAAQEPFLPWPPEGLLDMLPGVVDQMHVVDARRAGGHAGEARQAAVEMLGDRGRRRPVVLPHLLDLGYPSARAVDQIGSASCRGRVGLSV